METLGFGTHVIIDGYGAAPEKLSEHDTIRSLLTQVAKQLELEAEARVVFAVPGNGIEHGTSAGVVLSESQLALHVFPADRCFSLSVFTRRDLPLAGLHTALKSTFDHGRYESHQGNRARIYPQDEATLRVTLHGERNYVHARLDESLLTY